jgi:hypothetical protein
MYWIKAHARQLFMDALRSDQLEHVIDIPNIRLATFGIYGLGVWRGQILICAREYFGIRPGSPPDLLSVRYCRGPDSLVRVHCG